jgi:UDP-3-O-[3-hydroxymyristoyl] N-acetylglucosamine deacetylase
LGLHLLAFGLSEPLLKHPVQATIARPVQVSGHGLHTAVHTNLQLVPAPAGTGLVFRRTDLDGFEVEAKARNVARVSYATSLMKKGVLISTTEHVLAALYASGIDNVYIEMDNLEVPILDGSAEPFMCLLKQAGIQRLRKRRRYLKVLKPLEIVEGDRRVGILPADEFRITCLIDFTHPMIGRQELDMAVNAETFRALLASARTFGFTDDVTRLRAMGLIRGGSLENAIVLTPDGAMNGTLRYADEFCRHKALDLIGDLALLGKPLLGHVIAHRAGHALHTALVLRLMKEPHLWEEVTLSESATPVPAESGASAAAQVE